MSLIHPSQKAHYQEGVTLTKKPNGVAVITLYRPRVKNAVDRPTAEALSAAFRDFESDPHLKVGILYGAGGTFCAGADLAALAVDPGRQNQVTDDMTKDGPMGPSRLMLTKPVIAAIAGYAVAGGLELALWCDLRVVEEGATLGVYCRRWGVPLIDGGTVRLPRLIGLSRALDLILTGRPVDAREAKEIGLANRVVPKGRALIEAEHLAESLLHFPQECMKADRRTAYEQFSLPLQDALRLETQRGTTVLATESKAGARRFAVEGKGRGGAFEGHSNAKL